MSDTESGRSAADTVVASRWARRRRLQVTVLVLGAVVVGVVVGVLDGRHGGRSTGNNPSTLVQIVSTCLSAGGVVLLVGTFVWAWRTGVYGRSRQSPLPGTDRDRRRQVMREIRGRQPVDPHNLEVSTATARAMVAREWLVIAWVGVAFTTAGQLSSPRPVVVHVMGVVTAVFLVLAVVQTVADSRRARRFLDRHDSVEAGSLGGTGCRRPTA